MFSSNGTQVSSAANFIEDVFSCFLYTGTGAALTITNNIDLSTYGGLTWIKSRSAATDHKLTDTVRGATKALVSNSTALQTTDSTGLTAFGTTGFTVGANTDYNTSAATYVSWAFRKQPKFFDVVTWSGDGTNNRAIPHSLGSVPGSYITHATAGGITNWNTYHRSLPLHYSIKLNTTAAAVDLGATGWGTTGTPTSTVFYVDPLANSSGLDYVAYVFAHDAGGFGLAGTDNVISCGSFTTDGSGNATVALGYEPQWVMIKASSDASSWFIIDNMRGFSQTQYAYLLPNTSGGESSSTTTTGVIPNATGFTVGSNFSAPSTTYIYIAIRRGPMKVPTLGTSVFGLSARSGTGADATVTGGQTDDAVLIKNRGSAVASLFSSRLTGTGYLVTSSTAAEVAAGVTILQANPWDVMDGVKVGTTSTITNASANTYINYLFRRAPGFFDVVCYTGNSTERALNHNLTSVPELIIVKNRSSATPYNWEVWSSYTTAVPPNGYNTLKLNLTNAQGTTGYFPTDPTSSVFTVSSNNQVNISGVDFVAYLFATCLGVSKVGSYTGNGTTQTIDCGLTAGARFVLIKRTDAAGDWYVYDTARGMTVLTDPYLLLNSTAAEVATLGSVTTVATGFALNSAILAAINVNAGTYIFLAIA
jgi:hypothetical protein